MESLILLLVLPSVCTNPLPEIRMHLVRRIPTPMKTADWNTAVAIFYTLLLAMCFFGWPVVTGMPTIGSRLLWIPFALVCLIISVTVVKKSLQETPRPKNHLHEVPWSLLIFLCLGFLLYTATIPPLDFSDEITMSLPGLRMISIITMNIGWPALLLILAIGCMGSFLLCIRGMRKTLWGIIVLLVVLSVSLALLDIESGLAVRYPPLVHLIQTFGSGLTNDSVTLFRLPNVIWTLLLAIALWQWLPDWSKWRKGVLLLCLMTGPLGWSYRIVLMQACGEVTLGMTAAILIRNIITKEDRTEIQALAGYLGMTLALWILYRPTSVAVLIPVIIALWVIRRRRAASIVSGISLPIVLTWFVLSPLYAAQYRFASRASGGVLATIQRATDVMTHATLSLPHNLHPVALFVLLFSSAIVLLAGRRHDRILLLITWGIAGAGSLSQNVLAAEMFSGVARYSILILLPLGTGIGGMLASEKRHMPMNIAGILCVALLLLITPWDFVSYAQSLRVTDRDIWRSPNEGYLPTPAYQAVLTLTREGKEPAIVGPVGQLPDLLLATGEISAQKRERMMATSRKWSLSQPTRPVMILSPVSATYRPNLSVEEEHYLKEVRAWALSQPHTVVRLGMEEAIIVE